MDAMLTLRSLPYDYGSLRPHIGAATVETHYAKHHRGYVDKVNKAIAGGPLDGKPLEEIVLTSDGELFNNAAQVWNHDFYWRSLSPEGGGEPPPNVAEQLKKHFGGVDELKRELANAAVNHFGSGWAWLVKRDNGELAVVATHDADNPLKRGETALLSIDVWEHAYYLDYRNERAKYVDSVLKHLLNWDLAARLLG
jgi:superoxide dismutase, Fe-Mn family